MNARLASVLPDVDLAATSAPALATLLAIRRDEIESDLNAARAAVHAAHCAICAGDDAALIAYHVAIAARDQALAQLRLIEPEIARMRAQGW